MSSGVYQASLPVLNGGDLEARIAVALEVTGSSPPGGPTVPEVSDNGVVNAASMSPFGEPEHASAPGSMVTIFGRDFTAEGAHFEAAGLPLPTTLGGVTVTFDGIPAALFGVWPNQINIQLPSELTASEAALSAGGEERVGIQTATVMVENSNGESEPQTVVIHPMSPAIFTAGQTAWDRRLSCSTTRRSFRLRWASPRAAAPRGRAI